MGSDPPAFRYGPSVANGDPSARPRGLRRAIRPTLALAGILLLYYLVPVAELPTGSDLWVVAVGMVLGLGVLVYVAARQVRVLATAPPGAPGVRLDVLLLAVVVVVPLFALGYYTITVLRPEEFVELQTRTDALYFAVATLATVGYGDVHAQGQLARVVVTVQMTFDLVFVAILASIISAELRSRATERRDAARAASATVERTADPAPDPPEGDRP